MNRYTIYCTEEQTRKALKLGAPIESEFENQFLANQEHGYYRGGTFQGLVECMGENTTIFGNEPNRIACIIPTAGQMIGWLENNTLISEIRIEQNISKNWFYTIFDELNYLPIGVKYSSSRKEATIAAIDAALEYLNSNNN